MNEYRSNIYSLHHRPRALTSRRVAILGQLYDYIRQNGYSPTVRELTERLQLKSHSSVHAHLDSLERDGFVSRRRRAARSWELTAKARQILSRCGRSVA